MRQMRMRRAEMRMRDMRMTVTTRTMMRETRENRKLWKRNHQQRDAIYNDDITL